MKINYGILPVVILSISSCTKPANEPLPVDTSNKFVRITPVDIPAPVTSFWFFDELNATLTTGSHRIMSTLDSGITWTNSIVNGSTYLENLYFFNSTTGFCSDPTSSKFKTFKYNGVNWSEFDFPVKETYPSSFQMLSETQLYATTVKGNNEASYLLATNNGGASWDTLYEFDANFKEVLMLDEKTGFLLANGNEKMVIIKTNDGGKSWYTRTAAIFGTFYNGTAQLKKIIAIDSNNIIAIGRGAESNEGFIFTSVDGGDNWKIAWIDHALTHMAATETDVFFVGAELFVAQWKINTLEMDQPFDITVNWKPFDKETDFLNSIIGEVVSKYHHIIQVQFIDNHTGYILTTDANEMFKIKLAP